MDSPGANFEGSNLREVLEEARSHVLSSGRRLASARGETFSARGVRLVWQAQEDFSFWGWDREATERYYRIFVDGNSANQPESLAQAGELVFPYTYAARSRFWDGGWGAVLAVLQASRELGDPVREVLKSEESFCRYLAQAGERVHLQTLLAVWDWLGKEQLAEWLVEPQRVQALLQRTRADQLERVIAEIGASPGSRRAVTASFVLPNLDQRLSRLQGVPPYQLFQLLPGGRDEPLHSFHVHRSLDASDGVQLDFYHDYCWLKEACRRLGRPLGTITIAAGDYHVYLGPQGPLERGSLEDWLIKVTDGYRTGAGRAGELASTPVYQTGIREIYRRLSGTPESE